jgi:hypothetical protein
MASKNKAKAKSKGKKTKLASKPIGKTKSGRSVALSTDIGRAISGGQIGLGRDRHDDDLGVLSRPDDDLSPKLHELGRATDALVRRVVSSAAEGSRDPAEHVLDIAKAYYQEETSEGSYNVQCDRCGLKSPGQSSVKRACLVAEELGWFVTAKVDHCPVCRDGSKLLKPGTAALQTFGVSTGDMVLVVRLRWLGSKIEKGWSLEALLDNAARSGHRSMLSDLAQGFGYDATMLQARIQELGKQNADVPEVFTSGTAVDFVADLFARLKSEDEPA